MELLIGLILVATILAIWIAATIRKYARVMGDESLLAIAGAVSKLKSPAFAQIGIPIESTEHDARVYQTSQGLVVVYTVSEVERGYLFNHISISRQGGHLAWAAAGRFAYLVLRSLDIEPQTAVMAHTGLIHIGFLIGSADRQEFEQREANVTFESIAQMKQAAGDFMETTMRSGNLLKTEDEMLPSLLRSS